MENLELKQLVAGLSLEVYRLEKQPHQCLRAPAVSADEWLKEAEVLARVASSSVPKRTVLGELGVPRST